MKLEIWDKAQENVVKTFERDKYFLPLGVVEDILAIFEEAGESANDMQMALTFMRHKDVTHNLLKRIFPAITDEDIYEIPFPDIVPLFMDVVKFATETVASKN